MRSPCRNKFEQKKGTKSKPRNRARTMLAKSHQRHSPKVVANPKRVVPTVAARETKKRAKRSLQPHNWDVGRMPPLTLLVEFGVGPNFISIKTLSLLNRQAWSTQEDVGPTHKRAVTQMVDDTLSGPELL